jgi:transcriptional regulator NrdR family protein
MKTYPKCPICDYPSSRLLWEDDLGDRVKRIYRCPDCDYRWKTVEYHELVELRKSRA